MNVDEALQQLGQLVAAWDEDSDDNWLGIYVASDRGVKLLAHERNAGAARRAELVARKLPVGSTVGGEYVWAVVGDQLTIWNFKARLSVAGKTEVVAGGRRVADATRVVAFVDANDLGHRGVRVESASGAALVAAEEHDPAAEMDPTYNRDNLIIDAAWANSFGRTLAKWLGVPYVDQI
jgi:hypothetical protein